MLTAYNNSNPGGVSATVTVHVVQQGPLKAYVILHRELLEERQKLQERLNEIDFALKGTNGHAPVVKRGRKPGRKPKRTRARNEMSLKEAILKVNSKPMTKAEILDAVKKSGYKFGTGNPMNSINVVLYGKSPKFKNDEGKFSH